MNGDLKTPETQREMIYQLWYAIKGANGDGIWETVKRIERRVDELERDSATKEELHREIQGCLEADRMQDERNQWGADMGERRKGNKIALWALVCTVAVNVVIAVITLVGG